MKERTGEKRKEKRSERKHKSASSEKRENRYWNFIDKFMSRENARLERDMRDPPKEKGTEANNHLHQQPHSSTAANSSHGTNSTCKSSSRADS